MITPIRRHLLIELKGAYDNFSPTEEKFGTSKTRGIIRGIADDITKDERKAMCLTLGNIAYFGKYEDTAPYQIDGKDYALIDVKEIGGIDGQ